MTAEFVSTALSEAHDVDSFDCGVESLNAWLVQQARRAQQAGTARTFVWTTTAEPGSVRAYYSLVPTELARASLPRSLSAGYTTVPGYLLARLAIDGALHGFGYGSELLVDALTRAAQAADAGGGRLVIVDALGDKAASFYRHHDFTPIKDNPHRLVLKLANVRKLLDEQP